jgi:hypothetical protein
LHGVVNLFLVPHHAITTFCLQIGAERYIHWRLKAQTCKLWVHVIDGTAALEMVCNDLHSIHGSHFTHWQQVFLGEGGMGGWDGGTPGSRMQSPAWRAGPASIRLGSNVRCSRSPDRRSRREFKLPAELLAFFLTLDVLGSASLHINAGVHAWRGLSRGWDIFALA